MGLMKGSIILAELDPVIGSEQGKKRPAIIIQHSALVNASNTVIIVPISSHKTMHQYGFHVPFIASQLNLKEDGIIKVEHIRSIDKSRIKKVLGQAPPEIMDKILIAFLHATDFY